MEKAAYTVYVDDRDMVWLSDWGANATVRFDPAAEKFEVCQGEGPRQTPGGRPSGEVGQD